MRRMTISEFVLCCKGCTKLCAVTGPNHLTEEDLRHEESIDARERLNLYETMAVTDGSDEPEVLGPVSTPTEAQTKAEMVQTPQCFSDALKKLPLTLGS